MKLLKDAVDKGHVILDLDATDMATVVGKTVGHMVVDDVLPMQAAEQIGHCDGGPLCPHTACTAGRVAGARSCS